MSDSESPIPNGYAHARLEDNARLSRSGSGSVNVNEISEDDADLFGDDADAPTNQDNDLNRKLDDSELDSGDDEGRDDRLAHTIEDDGDGGDGEVTNINLIPAEISRIKPPEADELYLLNMPPFLGLSQKRFDPLTYEPPDRPHDSETATAGYSAFNTAATSLLWRRDPRDNAKLQSNSRIIRWSDGSLTLQIANSPKDQYRLAAKPLRQSFGKKNQKVHTQVDYDPNKDAQVYLAAFHTEAELHQIVAPVDASLRILPTGEYADESVIKLQQSLAAATNVHDPLTALKQIKEDPELAKKAAEMFEKDRMRTARKREVAEEKLLTRKDRVLGRAGVGRGGLSVAGLEDEDGMPTARGRKNTRPGKRRANRRGSIYSDDEDEDMPRGRTREDEYDLEDDFMARSDEEPETYEDSGEAEEDDPDVDDLGIEGRQTVVKSSTRGGERDRNKDTRRSRSRTPKRAAVDELDEGVGGGSPQARKKRRVIDDEDDDE